MSVQRGRHSGRDVFSPAEGRLLLMMLGILLTAVVILVGIRR